MKEILIFAAVVVLAAALFFKPPHEAGRYLLVEAKIRELVGIKSVTQIQENNALFRIDTRTGKTWRLTPLAQANGDHVMGWEELRDVTPPVPAASK
jgi:hypothetical protein